MVERVNVVPETEYLEIVKAPILTQEGDTIARVLWHSRGYMVETPDGKRRSVSEHALFSLGVSEVRAPELPGLEPGKWVTALKARFG